MKTPQFDADGEDNKTFLPFILTGSTDPESPDIQLEFSNWDWIASTYGTDTINDYFLNGYGVEGLVKATLLSNGIDPEMDDIDYDSEASTCIVLFKNLNQAVNAAELAAQMITNSEKLRNAIQIAREQGFEDG